MNKTVFARALAHALNQNSIPLTCREGWNGFTAGRNYEAIACGGNLKAADDHGLDTLITEAAAHFFEVADGTELAAELTEDEKHARYQVELAGKLRDRLALLVPPAEPFVKGEVLMWKPGLCNRRIPSEGALMITIETLAEPMTPDESTSTPAGHELLDLKVAAIARNSGREDDNCLVELVVDSRRVQRWTAQ
ncbi:hypothetical protein PEp14_00062 [Erwinia phage PEp14]|uniref:Uncharacterized protein n=1 Tax=Erwinia phage PEp14 TaxID=1131315 RepID=H2DE92_9CAUD|nr:hypothetical protein PEp14_00062 [Erwinia phage PEp14]AEY69651.1 hypothetical protein PEp14_00062 [Erwinia phage PEp14]